MAEHSGGVWQVGNGAEYRWRVRKVRILRPTKWEEEITVVIEARERRFMHYMLQKAGLKRPGGPAVISLYPCMSTCRVILSTRGSLTWIVNMSGSRNTDTIDLWS